MLPEQALPLNKLIMSAYFVPRCMAVGMGLGANLGKPGSLLGTAYHRYRSGNGSGFGEAEAQAAGTTIWEPPIVEQVSVISFGVVVNLLFLFLRVNTHGSEQNESYRRIRNCSELAFCCHDALYFSPAAKVT